MDTLTYVVDEAIDLHLRAPEAMNDRLAGHEFGEIESLPTVKPKVTQQA